MSQKQNEQEQKGSYLIRVIEGFGVPSNWAKVIAGAILGAAAACGAMSLPNCTTVQRAQTEAIWDIYTTTIPAQK